MIISNLRKEDYDKIGNYWVHNTITGETYSGSGLLKNCFNRHLLGYNNHNHKNENLRVAFAHTPNGWYFDYVLIDEPYLNKEENRQLAFDMEQIDLDMFIGNPLFMNISKSARKCRVDTTPLIRAKISSYHKGKTVSSETRIKLRLKQLEFHASLTQEEKDEKNSIRKEAGLKFYRDNPEARKKCATYGGLGNKHTDETKKLMSIAKKDIPLSEEHKQNLSASRSKRMLIPENRIAFEEIRLIGIEAKRHPVMADNKYYPSVISCAKAYGIDSSSAHYRINSPNYPTWRYADDEEILLNKEI